MHTKFYKASLLLFLFVTPSTFAYHGYEWSFEVHNRLGEQVKCTGCQKVMEQAQNKLPMAGALGKPALKAAVMAACVAMSAGLPFLIPMCGPMSNAAVDMLADQAENGVKKISPLEACKKMGMCPDC